MCSHLFTQVFMSSVVIASPEVHMEDSPLIIYQHVSVKQIIFFLRSLTPWSHHAHYIRDICNCHGNINKYTIHSTTILSSAIYSALPWVHLRKIYRLRTHTDLCPLYNIKNKPKIILDNLVINIGHLIVFSRRNVRIYAHRTEKTRMDSTYFFNAFFTIFFAISQLSKIFLWQKTIQVFLDRLTDLLTDCLTAWLSEWINK